VCVCVCVCVSNETPEDTSAQQFMTPTQSTLCGIGSCDLLEGNYTLYLYEWLIHWTQKQSQTIFSFTATWCQMMYFPARPASTPSAEAPWCRLGDGGGKCREQMKHMWRFPNTPGRQTNGLQGKVGLRTNYLRVKHSCALLFLTRAFPDGQVDLIVTRRTSVSYVTGVQKVKSKHVILYLFTISFELKIKLPIVGTAVM